MVSIVNSFVAVVVSKGASCLNMSLAVVYPCFSLLYIVTRCLILLIWKLVIKEIIFVLVSLFYRLFKNTLCLCEIAIRDYHGSNGAPSSEILSL